MSKNKGFRIQQIDIQILHEIALNKYLTMKHLFLLFEKESSDRLYRRIQKMVKRMYLERVYITYPDGEASSVLYITPHGARELVSTGLLGDMEEVEFPKVKHRLSTQKTLYIRHDLGVAWCKVHSMRAWNKSVNHTDDFYIQWESRRSAIQNEISKYTPDAVMKLFWKEQGDERSRIFLWEYDSGSMNRSQLKAKYSLAEEYLFSCHDRWKPVILFIVPHKRRLAFILQTIVEFISPSLQDSFFCAVLSDLSSLGPFSQIWSTANGLFNSERIDGKVKAIPYRKVEERERVHLPL